MKHLYRLIAKLTGGVNTNHMPESMSNQDLADDFVNYFLEKIL